jgi:hypothetical protein
MNHGIVFLAPLLNACCHSGSPHCARDDCIESDAVFARRIENSEALRETY